MEEELEADIRDDNRPSTSDLHFDPSTSEVKSKLLRVRERKELMNSLESLDLPTVCQEVESLVSKGMHLTIYPERKALWDTIKGSKALHNLISAAKAKFTQLYHSCGKGADKYSRFYFAWMQYMASYTSHKLSSDKATWINLTASCSSYISEDTSKVMICDILQSLQNYLTGQIAKELECKSINDDASEEACHDGDEYDGGDCSATSDDTALYRIGGWALLSAKRFRMNYITQNKGNVTELTEEICLLNELHLSKEAKMDAELPIGLTTLDRGGLTIPKKELLPYLRETETRILEFLNDLNYRRYGNRLFEVTKANVVEDNNLLRTFTTIVMEIMPYATVGCIQRVHKILVTKLYNCRCNEYLNAVDHQHLMKENKTVAACISLRDKLKTYAVQKQLK